MAAIGVSGWSGPTAHASAHLHAARFAAKRFAARIAPSALTIAGLGCIDTGAFTWNRILGWAVTGISLLVLEYRIDE